MAQGSAVLFAAQVIGNAGFFAAVLILARGLGPAGRGAVAFFIVTLTEITVGFTRSTMSAKPAG